MNDEKQTYFKVVAKCGHVGRKNYIPIQFPVCAESKKEAAKLVRNYPRVKHNHKDAILQVEKISFSEYLVLKQINDRDPYLHCNSRKKQKQTCKLDDRLVLETQRNNKIYKKKDKTKKCKKEHMYEMLIKEMEEEIYEYHHQFN